MVSFAYQGQSIILDSNKAFVLSTTNVAPVSFKISRAASWSLRGVYTLQYPTTSVWVNADPNNQNKIIAQSGVQRIWEWFSFYPQSDGTWSIMSLNRERYVCVDTDNSLKAMAFTPDNTCKFAMNNAPTNYQGTTIAYPLLQNLPLPTASFSQRYTRVSYFFILLYLFEF